MENNFRPNDSDSESGSEYDTDLPELLTDDEDYGDDDRRARSRSSGVERLVDTIEFCLNPVFMLQQSAQRAEHGTGTQADQGQGETIRRTGAIMYELIGSKAEFR